ncbi:PLP-dependent aminotransferase family protein [Clostridium sp. 'deep sea']|uniref:aminotransferase-like domain-containing protein n=1 Tax=Clostridium sp. 'deep sea' TaxID=2779445 RepID=UPI001896723F|nr:PLP-dependent aminotransferase family protein [Clostridium sp. 'deep sea']QOR35989.1 PLP-dependent aminotransferase family protein [Clostridium sp. 'deep sea']
MIDEYGNEITWYPKLKNNTRSVTKEIAQLLEDDILSGKLKSGFRLPSQRVLANFLNVNHSTVTRAFRLCEAKGLILGVTGKGTFVSADAGIPRYLLKEHESNIIEMGLVLPLYEVNPLIESCLRQIQNNINYNDVLRYVPPEGSAKHRYIAVKWLQKFNIKADNSNVIITAGTQNALSVILTTLFNKGDKIVVDQYTYTGFKSLATLLGIVLVPVEINENGINTIQLKEICEKENVKGIYLIPDCHNPTSISLTEHQRKIIAEIVINYNLLLIEDSYYAFASENLFKPISFFAPNNSFYIASFSKSINPSFRISYLVCANLYTKKLIAGINNLTWMASPINAEIISQMIRFKFYDEIIKAKRIAIVKRNKLVDEILKDYEILPNDFSFFRYLKLPQGLGGRNFELECFKKGVQVFSLDRFSVDKLHSENSVRISISGPKTIHQLKCGLIIIKNILDNFKCSENIII